MGSKEQRRNETKEQRNRGTEEQINKGTKEPTNKGTDEQRNKGTKEKRNKGTKEQRICWSLRTTLLCIVGGYKGEGRWLCLLVLVTCDMQQMTCVKY